MVASPTQQWSSTVRIINSNPYEVTVFVDAVNFAPTGESGHGSFLPLTTDEVDQHTIASWIKLDATEYVIPAHQTAQIPFTIVVPVDAPPGGHSAAIRVGTRPPTQEPGRVQVETSQIISALVFLRVTGDIIEDGVIREFRAQQRFLETPDATFDLRFENKGNVHLQPQGEIKIFNMWGQERGVIPVNRKSLFGKVLRESIRKYTFSWEGEWSLSEVGKYRAIATLAYGESNRQFVSAETTFWVVPWKAIMVIVLFILSFILFVTWAIKLYVRKMLLLAGVSPELYEKKRKAKRVLSTPISIVAPIEEGILDLSQNVESGKTISEKLWGVIKTIKHYRLFFLVVILISVFILIVSWFVRAGSVSDRQYQVTVGDMGQSVMISSEEVEYDKMKEESPLVNNNVQGTELPSVVIVNRSGVSGLAAKISIELESAGYTILGISNELGVDDSKTVIVYDPIMTEAAVRLSQMIEGALLSSFQTTDDDKSVITIYVGKDAQIVL